MLRCRGRNPFNFVVKNDDFFIFLGGSGFCLNSNPPCSNTRRIRESDLIFIKTSTFAEFGEGSVVKNDDFFIFWGGVWFCEPAVLEYATSPRVGFDFYPFR